MTVIPVTRNVVETNDNVPAQPLAANDTLNLSANAGIFTFGTGSASYAISAAGDNIMNLAGGVFSREGSAVHSFAGNHAVSIAATGSIYGHYVGFELNAGGNTITNAGRITGGVGAAIFIGGAGSNVITNSGAISSASTDAISLGGTGNTLNNTGTIEASDVSYAVLMSGSLVNSSGGVIQSGLGITLLSSGPNGLTNGGTIIATNAFSTAVQGNTTVETVINNGLLQSAGIIAVALGGGNDVYDGHNGGRVIGEVRGGAENDTLLGGSLVDVFRGEADNDTLNGGGGADFLDGGAGNDIFELGADTSDTIGDVSGIDTVTSTITRSLGTWAFIENLILQGAASINGTGNAGFNSIVGNGGNNLLAGQGGNDVLVGGGGHDQLFGQADKDSLTGGAGNDRFVFQSAAHTAVGLGDVIVDLDDNGDDVIDLTGIIPGVLTFIGQAAFTAAGQVRFQQVGGHVLVEINTTGPNGAEGEITLLNTTLGNGGAGQVNAADFLL